MVSINVIFLSALLFIECSIFVGLNVAATIVITRAVLPGIIPTAILSPLAIESVTIFNLHGGPPISQKEVDVKIAVR